MLGKIFRHCSNSNKSNPTVSIACRKNIHSNSTYHSISETSGFISFRMLCIYKMHRMYAKFICLITGKKLLDVNEYISGRSVPELTISDTINQNVLTDVEGRLHDVNDNYKTKSVIAAGGQGMVSNAFDAVLHRTVAIKSLKEDFQNNPSARKKFITEALVTASLEHSAIVPIYSLNSDNDNGLHLVMKKIRGKALRTYLQEICKRYESMGAERFDEEKSLQYRLEIFLRVCDAVACAHRKGIVHGDLKPENIMLNEYHEVYVMDWGIARHSGETSPDKVTGTVRYLPPETLQKKPADVRMDVYTLGVILYELVTLNFAFDGENTGCIVDKIFNNEPKLMRHRFGVRIKKDIVAIIEKAMQPNPEFRYGDAGLLAADLRAFMRDGETSARPDNFWRRYRRWSRRHHKLLAVINGIFFVLFCTAGFCLHYYNKAAKIVEEQRDSKIVSVAFGECYHIGQNINDRFDLLGDIVQNLSEQIALLLSNEVHSKEWQEHLVSVEDFIAKNKKNSGRIVDSNDIDIGKAIYSVAHNKYTHEHYEMLNQLFPVYHVLRNAFFNSYKSGMKNRQQKQVFDENKVQLSLIYFTLNNGLSVCYPGNTDISNSNDYSLKRRVLLNLVRGRRSGWSCPYYDVGKNRRVIFTGFRNIVVNEKKFGIAALDVPLLALEHEIINSGSNASAYTVYRRLLGGRGEIFLDIQGGEEFNSVSIAANKHWKPGKSVKVRLWDGKDKYLKNVLTKKYGSFIATESGRRYIYVFCRISALNFYYIEKINLEQFAVAWHIE